MKSRTNRKNAQLDKIVVIVRYIKDWRMYYFGLLFVTKNAAKYYQHGSTENTQQMPHTVKVLEQSTTKLL